MNEELKQKWMARISPAAKILQMTPENLDTRLAQLGVPFSEEGLAALNDDDVFKFGDFREAFKDHPIVTLRMAFRAIRGGKSDGPQPVQVVGGGDDSRSALLRSLGVKMKLEDQPLSVLLPNYNPSLPGDPITKALKARFENVPVIAFNDDGTVAVQESLDYMSDLEQNLPKLDAIRVSGKLVRLYPVGVKPNEMVDEDPLFEGRPLRRGYSTVNNRNWSGVCIAARKFCRVVAKRGEVDVNNHDAVLRLIERATSTAKDSPGMVTHALVDAYPEAAMEFNEMVAKDELPKLKVPVGGTAPKSNNPFGVKRSY